MNPLLTRSLPRSSLRGLSGIESRFTPQTLSSTSSTSPGVSPTTSPTTIPQPRALSNVLISQQCGGCGSRRPFSTTTPQQSRIGAAPVSVPKNVELNIFDVVESAKAGRARGAEIPKQGVEVKGPLGMFFFLVLFSGDFN